MKSEKLIKLIKELTTTCTDGYIYTCIREGDNVLDFISKDSAELLTEIHKLEHMYPEDLNKMSDQALRDEITRLRELHLHRTKSTHKALTKRDEKIGKMRTMLKLVKNAYEEIAADSNSNAEQMESCRTKDILLIHSSAHTADAERIEKLLQEVGK